jgi:hypothetical protein
MGKVRKPSNSVCYKPSSEVFRIYRIVGCSLSKAFVDDKIMIVDTVQCDLIRTYLLPLHVSAS